MARASPPARSGSQGTEPTCTVVTQDVEYRCTLGRAPGDEIADWTGTVEPTVDATQHVNGGCRSLNAAGTEWSCYIGEAAVEQQIIGPDFLGERVAGTRRRLNGAVLDSGAPMAAPGSTEEILDVNRRYHDVAAADYDAKWGVDFGEVGRAQVLGKVRKLLGRDPGPVRPVAGDRRPGPATSRST